MELDRLAGCGLFIPTAKGAVALDFVTCFVKCVVLLVRTSNWLFVVVLLDRLLNVLEDIDVDELLFRIKVESDNPIFGRMLSCVDFSNLLNNSSTLASSNSVTSAKVEKKTTRKSR